MKSLITQMPDAVCTSASAVEMLDRVGSQAPSLLHLTPRRILGACEVGTGRSVMVLDRDPMIRECLGLYLWQRGYTVWQAENAVDAFAILKQESIDLVVLDPLLRGISGAEVIRILHKRSHTKRPAIVVLSAKESEHSIGEELSIGADEYITKPVEVGVVEERIAALLRRQVRERQEFIAFPRQAAEIIEFPRLA